MRELPRWVVVFAALVIIGLLILNIYADIYRDGYEGYPTTLTLGGLLGGLLGLDRVARRSVAQHDPPAPASGEATDTQAVP